MSSRGARALALCAFGVALNCAALPEEPQLPDLRRGQASAAAGDIAGAERDLKPLAELGFLDAQISLAGVYAQSESPETIRKAVQWYRVAARKAPQVDVPLARALLKLDEPDSFAEAQRFLRDADGKGDPRALAALLDFYTDHPDRDSAHELPTLVARAEKTDKFETEGALLRWYRHNLEAPRNADKLAARCDKALDRQPECFVDLARYDRAQKKDAALRDLAGRAGKRYAAGQLAAPMLERAAWSMVSDSLPGDPQPDIAYPLLKKIMNTSISAMVRVARLQVEYIHLDPEANPEQVLLGAVAQGSDEAALALGRLYLNGTRVVADPDKALKYLTQAAPTQPAANYFLGRMYKRGENGQADPLRAAQYLLTAARGGYPRADFLLAQVFSDNRGARVNRANAYVFASLAARNGVQEGAALVADLRTAMTPAERRAADRLLADESAARTSDIASMQASGGGTP